MQSQNLLYSGLLCALMATFATPAMSAPTTQASATKNTPAHSRTARSNASQQFAKLAERYYEEWARYDPVQASFNGDNRFDDQLSMTIAPAVRAKHFAFLHQVQTQLQQIQRAALSPADQLSFDCLADELEKILAFEAFPEHLLPLAHMDSIPVTMAIFGSGQSSQRLTNVPQYQAYLKRLNQLPAWLKIATSNMRSGIKTGVVQPRAIVLALMPQIKALADTSIEKSDFYAPIRNLPASFSANEKAQLTQAYQATIAKQLLPALKDFSLFLEKEYLPAARSTAGLGALPNGGAWYKVEVKRHTTTMLSADEIHEIGLTEVKRIQGEMAKLAQKLGYSGSAVGVYTWLTEQAQNRPFKTEEDVLHRAGASKSVYKQ